MNREMTVAQLSAYLKGVFEDEELLHDVTLVGEVAEVSYSDRHTFLVLADGAHSVRCIHFSSRDKIEKGEVIAIVGSVDYYDKRNSVSFTYREFFTRGVGDKNAKLAETKRKLAMLGYFENRPTLPKYITDVIAVTSPDGAAIRDFIRVVYDKCPFVRIRVYPVKVQGEGAAAQITRAVEKLQAAKTDAIVICRGGGSDEDLDCFNDENLAVAVANSAIPVISAVGHEVDFTLCDFCAGTRAGTPSIAGEIVNSRALRIAEDVKTALYAMYSAVGAKYKNRVRKVYRLGNAVTAAVSARINAGYGAVRLEARRCSYAIKSAVAEKDSRLKTGVERLRSAISDKGDGARRRCEKLNAVLTALDPHRIIKVGYAAVLAKRKRVNRADELSVGDEVKLVFADGNATAVINGIQKNK